MATGNGITPASPGPSVGSDEALIYAWARSLGLTVAQAAGVLGNAQVESGFDPTSYNAREGATGIFQWEGGRGASSGTGLGGTASQLGLPATSLQAQLAYATKELQTTKASTLAELKTATTPAQAAYDWASGFEGNDPSSDAERESFASQIYAQIVGGQQLTGGPSGSASLTSIQTGGGSGGGIPVPGGGVLTNGSGTVGSAGGGLGLGIPGLDSITNDIVSGVETVLEGIAAPFVKFAANVGAVILGGILVLLALYLIASGGAPDIDDDDTAQTQADNGTAEKSGSRSGGGKSAAGTATEAATAAAVA